MDKTKQQTISKEQVTRYLKGLLRAAEIETDRQEKARKKTNYRSFQEQRENLRQAEINRLSKLIQKERAKIPKGSSASIKLSELEYELQAISNTVD